MRLTIALSVVCVVPDMEEPDWNDPKAKEDFSEYFCGMIDPIGDNLTVLDWQIVPEEPMIVPKRNIHEEPAHRSRNLLTALQLRLDMGDTQGAIDIIALLAEQANRTAEYYNKHGGQ